MKPPKSFRNIVNTLMGKRTKSSLKREEFQQDRTARSLDKGRSCHRSADDLADEKIEDDCKIKDKKYNKTRSQSLPRRSQSYNNVKASSSRQCSRHGRRVINGLVSENDVNSHSHQNVSLPRTSSQQEHISHTFEDSKMPRTTSWSHPQRSRRSFITDDSSRSKHSLDGMQRTNLREPEPIRRSGSAMSAPTSRKETEEKLQTCLNVLNQLSAQVKEIKDVSKRAKCVNTKMKNETLEKREIERRVCEHDHADVTSKRIKNLNRKGVEDAISLGNVGHSEVDSHTRPHKKQCDPLHNGYYSSYPTHPYPQSVSDMMSIWDAKELSARGHFPSGPQMLREDSASSGYATGSGSEDDRLESPNATDADSVASLYSMQGGSRHPLSRQAMTMAWKTQHFNPSHQQQRYNNSYNCYDPYAIYSTSADLENIYGTYRNAYGYVPSDDLHATAWYDSQQPVAAATTPYPTEANGYSWGYTANPVNEKYGGLSDLFYDPTAHPDVSVMESIAKKVAMGSHNPVDSNFKTYGSFRYRNGMRTITMPGMKKRKTVRFSQTVHRRVETEESEVEDSTSVIKGCADDDSNDKGKKSTHNDYEDASEIYMWPRQHYYDQPRSHLSQEQNSLRETIYEFPSGHIESSCMCNDCILARSSCQMQPTQAVSYY